MVFYTPNTLFTFPPPATLSATQAAWQPGGSSVYPQGTLPPPQAWAFPQGPRAPERPPGCLPGPSHSPEPSLPSPARPPGLRVSGKGTPPTSRGATHPGISSPFSLYVPPSSVNLQVKCCPVDLGNLHPHCHHPGPDPSIPHRLQVFRAPLTSLPAPVLPAPPFPGPLFVSLVCLCPPLQPHLPSPAMTSFSRSHPPQLRAGFKCLKMCLMFGPLLSWPATTSHLESLVWTWKPSLHPILAQVSLFSVLTAPCPSPSGS